MVADKAEKRDRNLFCVKKIGVKKGCFHLLERKEMDAILRSFLGGRPWCYCWRSSTRDVFSFLILIWSLYTATFYSAATGKIAVSMSASNSDWVCLESLNNAVIIVRNVAITRKLFIDYNT
ncbi:hypothetical protein SPSIL_042560 [Sporomusa silvacetica DSM 10669]|uniref:Uncharacterized protein n=1 Tax=Sporomusa silvacetica DSM 10669 TaxID=1123289 RepID=A0ABZ3IQQ4_9FIRM|nr:hypothetical protein SPSIL_13850 [Sporomusa silvacetica DSM 10669]